MIFDHVGIAVESLEKSIQQLKLQLALRWQTQHFHDVNLGVSVCFLRGEEGITLELVAPLGDRSPVADILRRKKGSLYQLAYRCSDLEEAVALQRRSGAVPLGKPQPAVAFGGARVQFLYSSADFVVELIEAPQWHHNFHPLT